MLLKSAALLVSPVQDEDGEVEREKDDGLSRLLDPVQQVAATLRETEGYEAFPGAGRSRDIQRRVEPRSALALVRTWEAMRRGGSTRSARLSVPGFVRLETAVSGIIRRLRATGRTTLRHMLQRADRMEAVTHFLAVLELVRQRQIRTSQTAPFGDITLEWSQREEHDSSSQVG
jgi:chromatin segregation and condensation protein Rec8/ScpA/Scc1 (kleisin family)